MIELIVTWWIFFRLDQKEVGVWSEMVTCFQVSFGTDSNFTQAKLNKF